MVSLIALLVFLLSLVLTPPIIALGWRFGPLDVPRDGRRMHTDCLPRNGGVAIVAAFLVGCFLLGVESRFLRAALFGGGLLLLVGLADDFFSLGAIPKLLFQIAVALAAVMGGGVDGGSVLFCVLWVVGLTNAHNFIDGIDGLLCATVGVEGTLLSVSLLLRGEEQAGALAFLLACAAMGFRYFNRHPAHVFAGDCGSQSLGFFLGMLSLPLFSNAPLGVGTLTPYLLFAYPITELLTSVLRRLFRRQSPFAADRAHLHHRLRASGISDGGCCLILSGISLFVGGVGCLLTRDSLWIFASLASLLAAFVLFFLRSYIANVK